MNRGIRNQVIIGVSVGWFTLLMGFCLAYLDDNSKRLRDVEKNVAVNTKTINGMENDVSAIRDFIRDNKVSIYP